MKTPTNPSPADSAPYGRPHAGWRHRLYSTIFESDTRAGRWFDIALIIAILTSVGVVVVDSMDGVHARYGSLLSMLEWGFTLAFTLEYILRLVCVRHPLRYARSGYGIIDLMALLPTYLAILAPGLHALIDVRVLRLLRIFRIFKLGEYVEEFGLLAQALMASRRKIFVFLSFVLMVVLIMGTLMYVVEGPENGFTNIPVSVYWAITTMTTVGFGDITPKTDMGRMIASLMMLLGWGTLAVPTGIVSAELTAQRFPKREVSNRTCPECLSVGHSSRARFCRDCGAPLE